MKPAQNRNPSPASTDVLPTTINEESPDLTEAMKLALNFRTSFDWSQVKRYEAIYRRYDVFMRRRERDRIALSKLETTATTFQQQAKYLSRLLSMVQKHSETTGKLSADFRCVIESQVKGKSK